jgi:3-oxoacyl-[acyl-carrier protein] reductase
VAQREGFSRAIAELDESDRKRMADRVVIVTGAATGIGRATAVRFAQERARVVAWDVKPGADVVSVDVTDAAAVNSAVANVVASYGRIDALINNAGIVRDAQLVKWKDGEVVSTLSDEQWRAVIDVNLTGVFNCTRAVVPQMIRGGGGVILNASSIVGLYGNFGQTNYVATKAGVIGMTKTWARELGRYKIRVNAVAPGFVATDIVSSMPDAIKQSMVDRTPLGRMGRPEDIAEAYAWLASDRASFVHGAVLSVDGGLVSGT